MKQVTERIEFETTTQIEFVDLTERVQEIVDKSGIRTGEVLVFAPHTTMGVTINHNEPMLIQDFMRVLYKLVPVDEQYSHDLFELRRDAKADGRSNGHSHCKAIILGASKSAPIADGHLMLSDIQSFFAVEFDGARKRDVIVRVSGE